MTPPTVTATPHATVHRPGCEQPGWDLERSAAISGITIARCAGCGAVELRREGER